jgi:hypothetical protein
MKGAITVPCPTCGAPEGAGCSTVRGQYRETHEARRKVWREQKQAAPKIIDLMVALKKATTRG